MTATEATAPAAKPASLWEDFIDIFYAPSSVFERRRNANPWPVILIVTGLLLLVTVLTFNSLQGVIEPTIRRAMEKSMAANPQFTQDMMDTAIRRSMKFAPWAPVGTPIVMLIAALVVWLVGKIFGSKANYTQSLVIVAYACITLIVGALIGGIQALVLDLTKLTNPLQLSLGPARFANLSTASPWTLGLLMTLDLISLWRLALVSVGLYVIGKTTKNGAWMFAVVSFLVLFLWNVRSAIGMVG
jgi:hypothetical protein